VGDERRLQVSGEFQIRQPDFGLTLYSLLGGALAVQDAVRLSFQIEARRGDQFEQTPEGGATAPPP
jgi:hypothetical protein